MPFLYEKMESLREFGSILPLPEYIPANLNPAFPLRPYQIEAFENYISWFESKKRPRPGQNLFHMATGSGKTLIMAGLMLYLYKQGYRNFLFFVNLSNIVRKTKENFLGGESGKYLFAREILMDGQPVPIREVDNFQNSDPNAVNICFTTTQGLHSDLWDPREGRVTLDDFEGRKVVLISDEAHHLNADTKCLSAVEQESHHSWESTVKRIFSACPDNVLLEFTATCDLENENIRAEYEDKIVMDYPLRKFRAEGYSKEIKTLRCDIDRMDRALQAIVLSQYRMKRFQDCRLSIKPVVLFKAASIADSRAFQEQFENAVAHLTGEDVERLSALTDNGTMAEVYRYFTERGITFSQLAVELREDFGPGRCISANDDREAEEKQLILNSLEAGDNPYRAVFEVKKLDEGWDVLNLFDIVRLYETRQSGGKKLSPKTVSEAQLIGRGARYCPFLAEEGQDKYRRKYDSDLDHPLRICEELYYHCQNDSRYIAELHTALRETGIDLDRTVTRTYRLKEAFKQTDLYRQGYAFVNDRLSGPSLPLRGLPAGLREKAFSVSLDTGRSGEDTVLDGPAAAAGTAGLHTCPTALGEIAGVNYAIVHRALCRYAPLRFDRLREKFSALRSTREFIQSEAYLGGIRVAVTSRHEHPGPQLLYEACLRVLGEVAKEVAAMGETREGSRQFRPVPLREVFQDKRCNYTDPHDGGAGISQKDSSVPKDLRLDLSQEDWFVYEDNFGTTEEKAFVAFFKTRVPELRKRYDRVYLIRNERQLHLYSFAEGERFEPDYLLLLGRDGPEGEEWLHVFIEPKGTHLLEGEQWKEDFLLELGKHARPLCPSGEGRYSLCGFHFFNREMRMKEFIDDMEGL